MTQYLIDIASWQTVEKRPTDPLKLSVAKSKGVSLVNIKTSQGDWYGFRSWMRDYAIEARRLGMGVSTFHWLDNTASGAAQAKIAYARMKELGGPDNMAHQCDCEDSSRPAGYAIWRDYVNAMQDLLGRKIVNYTGDWWWDVASRSWNGAALTPYLWAGPNAGYLGSYPGDTSAHWKAGYGGWANYSVLQYAVSAIEGAGGGKLSKSAIRDPKVWAALTGTQEEDMPLTTADEPVIKHALHNTEIGRTGVTFGEVLADLSAVPDQVAALKARVDALATQQQQTVTVDPVAVAKALIAELGRPAA